ncbi:MAG: HlyD family efflux transporter periplasmic adaptor subunit [Pirellulaceae bacterium]|nr:HlyD family efflux transporter periplasmic adaptor subunit [Pirellulaceae bacterium]
MKTTQIVACLVVGLLSTSVQAQSNGLLAKQDPQQIQRCFLGAIHQVSVPATEPGMLMSIEVEAGNPVTAEQPLAQIDDREAVMARTVAKNQYFAAKKQAENQISVEAAQKAFEVAKAELDTAVEANKKVPGTFSTTEVRRLNLTWERSGLQIDLARFELVVAFLDAKAKYSQYEQSEAMIEMRKLKSPIEGLVDKVFLNRGDWVQAGTPVMKVVQMDQLRVHGRVPSRLYSWSDVLNHEVEVTVTLPGGKSEKLRSKISFASNIVEEDGSFRVHADIPNKKMDGGWLMGPGLSASMRLVGK